MNKKILIPVIIVIVLIIGGGAYFVAGRTTGKELKEPQAQQEIVIPTIAPSDLGLSLSSRADKKAIILEIDKIQDISVIDYELSYTSKGNIPRGAIGHVEIKPTDTKIKKEIVLGTCSDVCHYDEGVSNIKLILKITKNDGKVYQTEQSFEL